ncbi:RNA polymerase sigma factor [Nonomuraea cavernae]|uniref:RNA polymerase sigma factor n=1 Tax=Nonomuraea cavernae TaxID=2045107 RepID=UPI003406EBCD
MRLHDDPAALEAFYRRHIDAVMRFVVRRVSDSHLAADLTADVFLAAVDSAHTYRPGRGSELGWLYGVARNVVAAQYRRTAREAEVNSRIAGRRLEAGTSRGPMRVAMGGAGKGIDFTIEKGRLGSDDTLVLAISVDGDDPGKVAGAMSLTVIDGAVAPCEAVPMPLPSDPAPGGPDPQGTVTSKHDDGGPSLTTRGE